MTDLNAPPRYESRLVDRCEVAERTWAFRFQRPPGFVFTAGQFMDVTLDSPKDTDSEGDTRAFSIASPPHEDDLTITTRLRDTAFKRTLASLPPGAPVSLGAAAGELLLHGDASQPAVILAGGIGITPFRSIVLDATRRKLGHEIRLFYSNRRPEDAPFLEELQGVETENPKLHFVPTMTGMDRSSRPWNGERGRIDVAMLARHAPEFRKAVHLIAGPPALVNELRAMVAGTGVPDHSIRAETFDGY